MRSTNEARRRPTGATLATHDAELDSLRREIAAVDEELVDLIAARCRLARSAGARKRAAGLPLVDPAQEATVVRKVASRSRRAGLPEEVVRQVFWCLIDLSREAQREAVPAAALELR